MDASKTVTRNELYDTVHRKVGLSLRVSAKSKNRRRSNYQTQTCSRIQGITPHEGPVECQANSACERRAAEPSQPRFQFRVTISLPVVTNAKKATTTSQSRFERPFIAPTIRLPVGELGPSPPRQCSKLMDCSTTAMGETD